MHFLFYNGNKWYKYTVFVKVTVKLWERAAGKLKSSRRKRALQEEIPRIASQVIHFLREKII